MRIARQIALSWKAFFKNIEYQSKPGAADSPRGHGNGNAQNRPAGSSRCIGILIEKTISNDLYVAMPAVSILPRHNAGKRLQDVESYDRYYAGYGLSQ